MAGDEDKKKKKKSKKATAEDAPPAEPEPEAAAEPEPSPAPPPPADEGDTDDWLNQAAEDEVPAPPQGSDEVPADAFTEDEVPVEGEVPLGEEEELPPQPKKKPKFFVHWDRRKAKFYDYNFDYGTNYYSSMIGYVDQKNTGSAIVPRRMAFAERGMYSSLERSRNPDVRTQSLLNDVRSSIRNFENSQRVYAYGTNRKKY